MCLIQNKQNGGGGDTGYALSCGQWKFLSSVLDHLTGEARSQKRRNGLRVGAQGQPIALGATPACAEGTSLLDKTVLGMSNQAPSQP